jgi:hypothetical protein
VPSRIPDAVQIAQIAKKQQEYAQSAMACFFQALRFDAQASAVIVPRILAMLAVNKDRPLPNVPPSTSSNGTTHATASPSSSPLSQLVKEELAQGGFPAAVLLPHIAYLVESLLRGERDTSKRLLNLVANKFPQALYLPMRTSLLQLRDIVTKWMREEERAHPNEQVRVSCVCIVCHSCTWRTIVGLGRQTWGWHFRRCSTQCVACIRSISIAVSGSERRVDKG